MLYGEFSELLRKAKSKNQSLSLYLLSILIISGFVLRVYNLGGIALWTDEIKTVVAAETLLQTGEPLLPSGNRYDRSLLHTYLVSLFIGIFGTSEVAARFPSVLVSTLTIPMTYLFARKVTSKEVGLIAALLLAFMSFEIAWARQVRMYPLYQFLFISTLTYWAYIRDDLTARKIVGVLVLLWLTSLSHYTWLILVPILACDALIHVKFDDNRYLRARKILLTSIGVFILLVITVRHPVFPPWVYGLIVQPVSDISFWAEPSIFFIERMPILVVFALVGTYELSIRLPRTSTPLIALWGSWFALTYYGPTLGTPTLWPRYLYFVIPVFCIASATGLWRAYQIVLPLFQAISKLVIPDEQKTRNVPIAVFTVLLLVLTLTAPALSPAPAELSWVDEPQPDYRTAASEIKPHHDESHFVASNRPLLVWHYLGDTDLRIDKHGWGLKQSGTPSNSYYVGIPTTESNDDLVAAVESNECGWVLFNPFPGVENRTWIDQNLEHYATVEGPYQPRDYNNEGANREQKVDIYRWGDCWSS